MTGLILEFSSCKFHSANHKHFNINRDLIYLGHVGHGVRTQGNFIIGCERQFSDSLKNSIFLLYILMRTVAETIIFGGKVI